MADARKSDIKMEPQKEPEPRAQALLCRVSGKQNFAIVGGGNRNEHFGDAWLMQVDPQDRRHKFVKLSTATIPRSGHAGGLDDSNKLYWFGGQNVHTGHLYNDVCMLDCTQLTCAEVDYTQKATHQDIPLPRNSHTFCFDPQTHAFILFAGAGGSGDLNDLHLFYPSTRSWLKKEPQSEGPWPGPREMHVAHTYLCPDDGKTHMLVIGGRTSEGTICNEVWDYRIETNTWRAFSPAPVKLAAMGSCVLGKEYLLLYGGTDGQGFLNDLWLCHVSGTKWVKLDSAKYLKNREGKIAASVCMGEDTVVIFGGCGPEQEYNDVELISFLALKQDAGIAI